jgi:hypothetical protein
MPPLPDRPRGSQPGFAAGAAHTTHVHTTDMQAAKAQLHLFC